MSKLPRLRCAVYTRKSTEEGLDQEFNSLDAQREACAAYVASQVGLGWKLVIDRYDDGGISGGTMERPALQQLLQDIRDRKVDVVVVYKIDRLTRSLTDFAKIVEVFDGHSVSFVSVTQQFNTTTSMGRLTLNVLLSFAQFEREVTAERIRDKIAASRRKGMWMGGTVPIGYRVQDRKLVISNDEASFVKALFNRYLELKSGTRLAALVSRRSKAGANSGDSGDAQASYYVGETPRDDQSVTADRDAILVCERYRLRPMSSGMLFKLLANPLYIGKVRHHAEVFDGEHEPLIDRELFEAVQRQLALGAPVPKGSAPCRDTHLLTGLLFDDSGDRMSSTHGKSNGRRYRYYVSSRVRRSQQASPDSWRLPAPEIEKAVLDQVVRLLTDKRLISSWVEKHAPADHIERGVQRALALADTISKPQPLDNARTTLRMIIKSITVSISAIRFEVMAKRLVQYLISPDGSNLGIEDTLDPMPNDLPDSVDIELPISLKRRGSGVRIVIDSPYAHPAADESLVDLIARAHVYLDRLTGSSPIGTTEIASSFSVDRADVGRILPLAFLSPQMLDEILNGRQSKSLSARRLARMELPMLWADQQATLQ